MTEEGKEILDTMKALFGNLNSKIDTIDERLIKIETTQENVISKNIQLLAEGHSAVTDKIQILNKMEEDLASIKIDVKLLKKAVGVHSIKINKLGRAK